MSNQPTPEQIALKPCPFCGAPLAVEKFTRTCQQAIHPINGCCLSDMKVFPMGNGYKQWNTRANNESINEKLLRALKAIALQFGNLPLERLDDCAGVNEGRLRSLHLKTCIEVAREAIKNTPEY